MSQPTRFFYMPRNFEVEDQDTLRLSPKEKLQYFDLTKAYWRSKCDLTLEEAAQFLRTTTAKVRLLVTKIEGFVVQNEALFHQHLDVEYNRAETLSKRAINGANARWNKGRSDA